MSPSAPRAASAFGRRLAETPLDALLERARRADRGQVLDAIERAERRGAEPDLRDFATLISPAATPELERMARLAQRVSAERFGRTVQLYAPLYLSNECVSTCVYCGFSRENDVVRRTLTVAEVLAEARILLQRGLKHLLLVTGEHPRAVSIPYLRECVGALRGAGVPSIAIELAPLDIAEYRALAEAGAEGLVVYQETYHRDTYRRVHLRGKKRDYDWRLGAPERGAAGGMRRLSIGALLGLHDWREDAIALAAHARFLMREAWQCSLNIGVPRLRPAAGGYTIGHPVSDREFVQLLVALRLTLPDVGITLSTRESAALRDRLIRLGVTQMSAGSSTEPGGYARPRESEPQFEIEDLRSPADVAEAISRVGYDPVWKDWEEVLHA